MSITKIFHFNTLSLPFAMSSDPLQSWEREAEALAESVRIAPTGGLVVTLFKVHALVKYDGEINEKKLDALFSAVLATYPRANANSRYTQAIGTLLDAFVARDAQKYSKNVLAFVAKLSPTPMAVADLLVLLQWNCRVLGQIRDDALLKSVAKVALSSSINLLAGLSEAVETSADCPTVTDHHIRAAKSGRTHVVAAMTALLNAGVDLHTILDPLMDAKLPVSGVLAALGCLAESCMSNKAALSSFRASEPAVAAFLVKDVFSTKTFPTRVALAQFASYLDLVQTEESFVTLLLPGLEKAALRNSELAFAIFAPAFLQGVSFNVLPLVVKAPFFTKLISSLKATKEQVKIGAAKCLAIMLAKSQPAEETIKVLDETLKALKAVPSNNFEHKILLANVLQKCPLLDHAASAKILADVLPLAQKDANEMSLRAVLDVLFSRFVHSIECSQSVANEADIIAALNKGLADKKLKSVWATSFAAALIKVNFPSDAQAKIISILNAGVCDALFGIFQECTKSPLPSITNKIIGGGYAALAILFHLKDNFSDDTLTARVDGFNLVDCALAETESHMSCFTNSKVITKITAADDQIWFVRALFSISNCLVEENSEFGFACLYAALSRNFHHEARMLANKLLESSVVSNQVVVSASIVSAINAHITTPDPDLNFDYSYLPPFISSLLTGRQDKFNVESTLIKLLVPAHHELFGGFRLGWIGICQKAGLDPGHVVSTNAQAIVDIVTDIFVSSADASIFRSASGVVGTASFVSPESIVPLLINTMQSDFAIIPSIDVDDLKLAIWRAKDGELVHDVLAGQSKNNVVTKGKDADTLKWEQSVRKELAAKNKTVRKLTKDEQATVDKQLELESSIRNLVNSQYAQLRRSLEIIISLSTTAKDVENGKDLWFPVAIEHILQLLASTKALCLCEELATTCFLAMALAVQNSSLTDTSSMQFIGSSTLRLHGVTCLPASFTGKPLNDLLSSQLFSLKMAADKSQFNKLTLMYVLPLLVKIIENGKIYTMKNTKKIVKVNSEFNDEAPEEEQLALALEIISVNGDLFEDVAIPRTSIIQHLVELLALPTKAKITKDCFVTLCQNIAPSMTDNDLNILLKSLIIPVTFVRSTILEVLDEEFDLTEIDFNEELWISRFDNEANNAEIAQTIWTESNFKLDASVPEKLISYLGTEDNGIRLSVGKALGSSVVSLNDEALFKETLDKLLDFFREMALPPLPKTDEFGLVIKSKDEKLDRWEQRSGVALSLRYMAPMFKPSESVQKFFKFAISERALGDQDAIVRSEIQDAGMHIINLYGKSNVEILVEIFETALEEADEKSKVQDNVKEATIILYGNLARHLDAGDQRIENTVERLLKALDTPSEDVQYAVSECIAPLVQFTQDNLGEYFDALFDKLFGGASIAERRGAAYGIAGLVKGYGIKALAEFDVIRNLTDASDDGKDFKKREGVSFALECLSQSLGPLFEPYILEILPILLKSFGDHSAEVREATAYAAKVFMKNTTSYGIKKMIPIAIANLEDYQWRSKKGSVELLGSMAYLDPTQLSSSLPEIVPNIVQVLKDTHKEVRKAADSSLKKFGEVIRNPEIQAIVQDLLNAIGDPTKYTDVALEKLINTQFAHYIDGPSLALIIHVIDRGMQDRSSIVKKRSSQIIGNMAILVDSRDIMPYLAKLVEELQTAIVDPVDETRAIASRALGSLVEKLGEEKFPGLIDNLMATLSDEERAGDRIGCAQALAEVMFGLGLSKLEDMLPHILQGANSQKSFIREGYMPMLLYLPVCFGSQFAPYLSQTIPPILSGLADMNEDVRQVSMKAGRLIVTNYAKKAVDLLLPELEKGLFDVSPRIRQSSADLTGELLYKISGISGKMELAEDIARASNVSKSLVDVLGQEKRDQVLSALFVCRSDTHGAVRNAASDVWKALVANTPRTIKEILPTLTVIIVRRLASPNDEQRNIAAATLGDMVRRIGSNALSQLLPTLEESMMSSDSDAKQGICIAAKELIESSSDENVIEYQDTFVKIVKDALVDANPSVRESAAHAFDILQSKIGSDAVDEVVPQLLEQLNSGSDEALSALQEIMSTKSDVIFPILLPSLLAVPINAKAIGALAEVAGSALYKRLGSIINALVDGVINKSGDVQEIQDALVKTIVSVDSDAGAHPLMQQILSLMKHEDVMKREVIYRALPEFFKNTTLDYSIYTEDVVIQGIYNLNNKDKEIAKNSFEMLTVLVKAQRKEMLERLIKPAQQTMSHISGEDEIYAFTLPRGPSCVLPIFINGLMYGTPEQRQMSADGITIVIEKTPAAGLKPFVTGIVGPLIRVIGERYNGDVKSAILLSLNKLFEKIPQLLRPFIPQLQRTFIKCLTDGSSELLRSRSAKAIGTLIEYQPKVDPLVIELLNNFKNVENDNEGIKSAILKALLEVIDKAGDKMSEASKNGIMELIEREMGQNVNVVTYAELIGSISRILKNDEFENMIKGKVLNNANAQFAILILNAFLKFSGEKVVGLGINEDIVIFLVELSSSGQLGVTDNAVLAIGKMLLLIKEGDEVETLITQLGRIIVTSNSVDVKRLGLTVVRAISNENFTPIMMNLVPSVFTCVRDPVLPVKLAGEKALLSLLNLVENTTRYDTWVSANPVDEFDVEGRKVLMRSITEYVKRIGMRLANQERERLGAGGDKEAMFSDLYEERAEIWSVSV